VSVAAVARVQLLTVTMGYLDLDLDAPGLFEGQDEGEAVILLELL
jgi:hypothetical protein